MTTAKKPKPKPLPVPRCPRPLLCKCSLRVRLLGDGCMHCNPDFWREALREQAYGQERAARRRVRE